MEGKEETVEEKAVTPTPAKPSLKDKVSESVDVLKAKLVSLREKNKELLDTCKAQAFRLKEQASELADRAGHSKPALASKSLFAKVRDAITRVKVLPEKRILCFSIGGQVGCLYGYIELRRNDLIIVRDAVLVEYVIGGQDFKIVREAGSPYICRENVVYIVDRPVLAGVAPASEAPKSE
jgi:hypothetical protein